ncbi:MAG TPA: L,D-transpeptidase family protein [Acetobacteraceae bacterium]|nr:L,D-transpeptidase family protein [Acetobacteraceae bacterium]
MATRREFCLGLLGATVASAVGPKAVADEGVATGVQGLASLIEQSANALSSTCQGRMALIGTRERLQLSREQLRGRSVLVNIAAAEAIAWEADGTEVLRSRVIVGTARTPTPRLGSPVPSIRINPPWYVPRSIEPEIRSPEASGFRRIAGRLVLPPGPRNPLGPIRIGLENSEGVFLHGTSEPGLFSRTRRALSHGCVRVERAIDLAAWMLDWTPEGLRAVIALGRTLEFVPPREVRVVLGYLTVWPAADGTATLQPDLYRLDAAAAEACRTPPAAPRI